MLKTCTNHAYFAIPNSISRVNEKVEESSGLSKSSYYLLTLPDDFASQQPAMEIFMNLFLPLALVEKKKGSEFSDHPHWF